MSVWRDSRLGRQCELGILHLGLFVEDIDINRWELFLYLRPGVTLGITSGHARPEDPSHQHVPRIAKLAFEQATPKFAEQYAEHLAQCWLDSHLEDLIAGKRFSA
jgi:hypothetical protein